MKTLDLTRYNEPGLYLEMPDGERVILTRSEIEQKTQAMLDDPKLLSPTVRAAADYQLCEVCPERETAQICHAIMTTLPFFDEIDRYMSYDRVTAVFRETETDSLTIKDTTMQGALQYISILSLVHYCEVGRKYSAFFEGVNPLMSQGRIADAVFRNMYLACEGDLPILADTLCTMQEELLETTKCQVKRLQLISKRDAFLNAFIATETTTELMLMQLERMVSGMATHAGA